MTAERDPMGTRRRHSLTGQLEAIYARYNRPDLIALDPLSFVYRYADAGDREIVGLIASSLAYGRVVQINRSVEQVLGPMGPSPRRFVLERSSRRLDAVLRGFRHRFTTGRDIVLLLDGARRVIERDGSLGACFAGCTRGADGEAAGAMARFVDAITAGRRSSGFSLLPSPSAGSACKRLTLYLRWMIRSDAVDPGVWSGVSPAHLLVPVDTHMYRVGRRLGFTRRRQADLRTVIEITSGFRDLAPADPARFDFALTHLGMSGELDLHAPFDRLPLPNDLPDRGR